MCATLCVHVYVLFYLEIPLFHIMTAKVTFGNINGVDSAATHVTLQDALEDQVTTVISTASSTSGVNSLKQRRQGGSSSTQPFESSVDSTGMNLITVLYNCVCSSVMCHIFRHALFLCQQYVLIINNNNIIVQCVKYLMSVLKYLQTTIGCGTI